MHDVTDLEGLLGALEVNPGSPPDPLPLAALADWYDDHGDPAAADCLREAARARVRPGYDSNQITFGRFFWELRDERPIHDDPAAQLPRPLWDALGEYDEKYPVTSFKSYRTARAAYEDLLRAWRAAGPMTLLPGRKSRRPG